MQQHSMVPPGEQPLLRSGRRERRSRNRIRLRYRFLYVGVLAFIGLILMARVPHHRLQTTPSASSHVQAAVSSGTRLNTGTRNGGITLVPDPGKPPPVPPPVTNTPPAAPGGSCVSFGGIDWGACWSGFWGSVSQGIAAAISGFIDWATSFIPMFTTSPALTYKAGTVVNLWTWSLGVADAALVLFLVIGSYNAMMRHTLGASYHSILEFLPRLLLAAVAANFSLTFIGSFIEINNALCLGVQGVVATAGAGNLALPWGLLNIVTLPFYAAIAYLIEGIVGILLIVQALVRVALLDILTILAPIWLLLLGLKQTERFGKLGATAFGATCFLQFLQVLTEGTGSALTASIVHASATPISILVGVATLYLAFKIPGMLYGAMLRPVEQGSSAISDMGDRLGSVLLAAP